MGDPFAFEERQLSSGAKLFHRRCDMPWTGLAFNVLVGHMHDPIGQEGTAHLLEHCLSSGSIGEVPAMPKRRLREWVGDRELTVNFGQTGLYWSRYGGRCLNENAGTLFRFLSDLVFRPGFDSDIEHDRAIIRAERADRFSSQEKDIDAVLKPIFYGTHRRATCNGLPDDAVLDGIGRKNVIRFHRRCYGAPNLRVISLGGLLVEEVEEYLEQVLPKRTHPAFQTRGPIPALPMEPYPKREWTFDATSGRQPTAVGLRWYWKLPIDGFPVRCMAANCLQAILMENVREGMRAAYDVSAATHSDYDHAQFEIATTIAPESQAKVRAAVEAALLDVDAFRFRIRRIRRAIEMEMRFFDKKYAHVLEEASLAVITEGRIPTNAENLARFAAVTEDDVARFVRESLAIEKSLLVIHES